MINKKIQKKEFRLKKTAFNVDGDGTDWMIVEVAGVQVHLMEGEVRQNLELEKLWTLGDNDDQVMEFGNDPIVITRTGARRTRVKYD